MSNHQYVMRRWTSIAKAARGTSAAEQGGDLEVGGVEDRDDRDRDEVVDDRKGQQERAQRRGQVRPDDGEHGQREGDVRRRGDRPPAQGRAVAAQCQDDADEDERRHDDPAHGGRDGHRGLGHRAQLADEELALELEPGDEEEDREQAVGRPVPERQPQVAPLGPHVGVSQGLVGLAPRAVREDQRRDRGTEQQGPADRLGAQRLGDVLALGPRRTTQDGAALARGGRVGHGLLLVVGRDAPWGRCFGADQTSRRSAGSLARVHGRPPVRRQPR